MPIDLEDRDATTALVLGAFLVMLALPVAAGALFEVLPIDRILCLGSAAVLALVGGAFVWRGLRPRSRP